MRLDQARGRFCEKRPTELIQPLNGLKDEVLLKEGRKRQEVSGFVNFDNKLKGSRTIHIVAEGWPSWLPAVLATGHRPHTIYINDCRYQTYFEANLKGRWKRVEEARGLEKAELVFISGSECFVEEWCGQHGAANVIAVIEQQRRKTSSTVLRLLKWRRIGHAPLGGVTDCKASVGLGDGIPTDWTIPVVYNRDLSHIIASATVLISQRGPKGGEALSADGLLLHRAPLTRVMCPSVFKRGALVARRLSVGELADCYDLPMALATRMKQDFTNAEVEKLPFLLAAPVKIHWAVAFELLGMNTTEMEKEGAVGESDAVKGSVEMLEKITVETVTEGEEVEEMMETVRKEEKVVKTKEESSSEASVEESSEARVKDFSSQAKKARDLKATKDDDAAVPLYLWNDRIEALFPWIDSYDNMVEALEKIRGFLKDRWCRILTRSFGAYMRGAYGSNWTTMKREADSSFLCDLETGSDCIRRAAAADWWEWHDGSRPFFWRWPTESREAIRDGMKMWQLSSPPTSRHPQPQPKDEDLKAKLRAKLKKVRERRYIVKGQVKNTTTYFSVPKGEDDIRVVYDATSSGLNDTLWAPSFGLPTVDSVLRAVEFCTWLGDNDLGEMFLNFVLSKDIREYAGIDLTPYFEDELLDKDSVLWERWERCMMGLTTSPYQAVRAFLWGEEIMRGDRRDSDNVFRWDELRLNLPGSASYDPTKPWVSKIRTSDQRIAADFFCYIDDVRPCGASEEECWQAARRVASICSYLGIQDASRKRRPPSQAPGAWAGSVVAVTPEGPGVSVSQEKWDKTRRYIAEMQEELAETGELKHKDLEKKRGFLVYVTRTYPAMVPYLKGIHLTLDSWRPNRGTDGWKLSDAEIKANNLYAKGELGGSEFEEAYDTQAPAVVRPVGRLVKDLEALALLTAELEPPVRVVRSSRIVQARYGFGDASGGGFGASIEARKGIWYRHGIWGPETAGNSSNFRELCNLVDSLEKLAAIGELGGTEVFLFTDNTVAESAFYRGTSASPKLFDLVLRLRKLEMASQFKLHLLHVPGTRMIEQGTDGLSRGNLTEGVMTGKAMRWFVPLDLSVLDRVPKVLDWVRSWTQEPSLQPLEPEEWFTKGQDMVGGARNSEGVWIPRFEAGTRLWVPAPAAADVAIEQLRYARHRRQNSMHIFLVPRLCTHTWRKWVFREADFVCEIPPGIIRSWKKAQHEPLILGICFPFIPNRPWKLRRHESMVVMEREMQKLCKSDGGDTVTILRELLLQARRMGAVQE